ncbi:MAG: hypothetical protein B9S30_06730 [Verrucomicrobiia bacterium Tous-C5FEB]|nr:MAG: hypothetical protein B9S30_06730 [Verrucomicrobiae bacterium Tous-C5FEB]
MKLYLVAAGGSGAKVAEALVHLCAAGLGPESLHILSVDTDDDNGNLARLVATESAYQGCRKFKWARGGTRSEGTPLPFGTAIKFHKLSATLDVSAHGLQNPQICPAEHKDVLDLFFSEDEQKTRCSEGFLARPNLGSLILGRHITHELGNNDHGGADFLADLADDLEIDSRLMVVGSVFGGTGASVLPVAPDSILHALVKNKNAGAQTAIHQAWAALPKGAVMLLPYFKPTGAPDGEGETVDPSRFLADTKNALLYYDASRTSRKYSTVHVIGTENPDRQRLKFCAGSRGQCNAPSVEELVAALACLETDTSNGPIRICNPVPNADYLRMEDFPWPGGKNDAITLSLFLHAACFTVRRGETPMDRGILQFLKEHTASGELPFWPWAAELLTDGNDALQSIDPTLTGRELAHYFLRLLLWAKGISGSRADLDMIRLKKSADALEYWQALCAAKKNPTVPDTMEDRVPLAVTMACACTSGIRTLRDPGRYRGLRLLKSSQNPEDDWIKNGTGPETCILPFCEESFSKAENAAALSLSLEYGN